MECCYSPGDLVSGSWVAVATFRACGAVCGSYICLLSDMSEVRLYWGGHCFLKDLGSFYVAALEEDFVVSVLCSM
nr:MAG TPA: hypothetical protein [Caudoviricetes sp.]